MATTLAVSFVLGRYHATPWGRHVNEGAVELPPSPWRLLRALYAVWKTRAPDLDASVVAALLGRLAEAPTYYVPPHRLAHTRHYYPDSEHRSVAKPSVDRTLDAFAVLDKEAELGVRWPFDLEPEQRKALERLASSLPYLGRADSVCQACVVDDWQPPSGWTVCAPVDVGESIPASIDVVRLLCPTLPLDLDALVARPVDVRAGKLLFPPSTRFVGYVKPKESGGSRNTRSRPAVRLGAVRYSVLNRVPPSMSGMVTVTHLLRKAILGRLDDQRSTYWWFAGKNSNGDPLEGHRHPHYLALPDEHRKVGELAVWLPEVDSDEGTLRSLSMIRRLHNSEDLDLVVRMSGYGPAPEILSEYVGPAAEWISATPFVPTGHRKGEWQTFVRRRLLKELSYRQGLPDVAEVIAVNQPDIRVAPRRPYRPGTNVPTPMWLRLKFDQPVEGPIVLGRLAHFGLGLFRAVK